MNLDFVESDRQCRTKPGGGQKRKFPTVETLIRKRVTRPTEVVECHTWLHEMETGDLYVPSMKVFAVYGMAIEECNDTRKQNVKWKVLKTKMRGLKNTPRATAKCE
ncbi:unnamed protein product [Dovyalis caffra]|uniref:Uncharacterized protein n=1 Tax=Dovyalis caffra TaxID=77055 RepID=A0AAV1S365_9ROSI|nr:unnamed protein product [Dovyalis caffra]